MDMDMDLDMDLDHFPLSFPYPPYRCIPISPIFPYPSYPHIPCLLPWGPEVLLGVLMKEVGMRCGGWVGLGDHAGLGK